jgi:putative tricarboxylic transport membrane protein
MPMEHHEKHDRSAASTRVVEMVTATLVFLLGVLVIVDSVRLGHTWGADGPGAGYFIFYIGVLICGTAGIIFYRALGDRARAAKAFVTRGALAQVMRILVPSIIYVALIKPLGIYVCSTLFIAYFMRWLGRYRWPTVIGVAVAVSVIFYVLFEVWFKVPLPKGPLESWLGID